MHLADQGAEVIGLVDATQKSAHRELFSRNKTLYEYTSQHERDQRLAQLIPAADIILEDASRTTLSADLLELVQKHQVIHAHLPDFDPHSTHSPARQKKALPSGVLEAFMGLYESPLARKPMAHHLSLLDVTSAAWMSCAVMAALIQRQRTGHVAKLTLPRADVAYPLLELNAIFTVQPPRSWSTLQWASTPFIAAYPCKDSRFIYVHLALRHHLQRFLESLQQLDPHSYRKLAAALSEQTREEPTCVESLIEHHKIVEALEYIFAQRDALAWEEVLSDYGLCAVMARSLEQWYEHTEHPVQAGILLDAKDHEFGDSKIPGRVATLDEEPFFARRPRYVESVDDLWSTPTDTPSSPDTRQTTSQALQPLDGIKVLDLTHVIAGPASTRVLAELGAEVLRIENPHFQAPWVDAFHLAFNAGKSSVTLDLQTTNGQGDFAKILNNFQPDIVALNLRPGAGKSSGVSEDQLRGSSSKIIYAHLTAYGTKGEWGKRPGWEQTAQAACGVQLSWGADEGHPDLFPLPFNDLCTGLHGCFAMLLGLYARECDPEHGGHHVETNLVTTTVWMQALAYHGGGRLIHGKSTLGRSVLSRFYKTRDDWGYLHVKNLEALHKVEGLQHIQGASGQALSMSLETEFKRHGFKTWQRRFRVAGLGDDELVWIQRRTPKQVLSDPDARRRSLVHRRRHDWLGVEVTETGSPLLYDGHRAHLEPASEREKTGEQDTAQSLMPWVKGQLKGAIALGLTRRRQKS